MIRQVYITKSLTTYSNYYCYTQTMIVDFKIRESPSPHIDNIWQATLKGSGSLDLPAKAHWDILITKGIPGVRVTLSGPTLRPETILYNEIEAEYIGIQLSKGRYIHPENLQKEGNSYIVPWHDEHIRLGSSTAEIPTYENVGQFVDEIIAKRVILEDAIVSSHVQKTEGSTKPARTVQRHYQDALGLTPKNVQQIMRAQEAYALLSNGQPPTTVAYDLEYADQAHMSKSLTKFLGLNPSQIITKINKNGAFLHDATSFNG
jgi:hypothetical protein